MKQEEILGYSQCRFQTVTQQQVCTTTITVTAVIVEHVEVIIEICQHVEGKVDGFLGLYSSAFHL